MKSQRRKVTYSGSHSHEQEENSNPGVWAPGPQPGQHWLSCGGSCGRSTEVGLIGQKEEGPVLLVLPPGARVGDRARSTGGAVSLPWPMGGPEGE